MVLFLSKHTSTCHQMKRLVEKYVRKCDGLFWFLPCAYAILVSVDIRMNADDKARVASSFLR